jgi:hypothetical protein
MERIEFVNGLARGKGSRSRIHCEPADYRLACAEVALACGATTAFASRRSVPMFAFGGIADINRRQSIRF